MSAKWVFIETVKLKGVPQNPIEQITLSFVVGLGTIPNVLVSFLRPFLP
jgi:hypothetical protein